MSKLPNDKHSHRHGKRRRALTRSIEQIEADLYATQVRLIRDDCKAVLELQRADARSAEMEAKLKRRRAATKKGKKT